MSVLRYRKRDPQILPVRMSLDEALRKFIDESGGRVAISRSGVLAYITANGTKHQLRLRAGLYEQRIAEAAEGLLRRMEDR